MKEQIVSLKTAKLLKEVGFNYPVINQYIVDKLYLGKDFAICEPIDANSDAKNRDVYSAPTQCLTQKWLREELNIIISSNHYKYAIKEENGWRYSIGDSIKTNSVSNTKYNTYEEALEEGLQKAIKLIKNNKV